jgi:hypothetical protein
MPLVCEISIEAYCRTNDVIRPLIIHAFDRMSPKVTIHAQFWPIYIAFLASLLALDVRLYDVAKRPICPGCIEAYCRPNHVIRPLVIHLPNRLSPNLTIYAQFRPFCVAFAAN